MSDRIRYRLIAVLGTVWALLYVADITGVMDLPLALTATLGMAVGGLWGFGWTSRVAVPPPPDPRRARAAFLRRRIELETEHGIDHDDEEVAELARLDAQLAERDPIIRGTPEQPVDAHGFPLDQSGYRLTDAPANVAERLDRRRLDELLSRDSLTQAEVGQVWQLQQQLERRRLVVERLTTEQIGHVEPDKAIHPQSQSGPTPDDRVFGFPVDHTADTVVVPAEYVERVQRYLDQRGIGLRAVADYPAVTVDALLGKPVADHACSCTCSQHRGRGIPDCSVHQVS